MISTIAKFIGEQYRTYVSALAEAQALAGKETVTADERKRLAELAGYLRSDRSAELLTLEQRTLLEEVLATGRKKFLPALRQEGADFLFADVPYQGSVMSEVLLPGNLLDHGTSKTHPEWRAYCGQHPQAVLPNSELLYQLCRQLYHLRDDAACTGAVQSCLSLLRTDWTKYYPHTGTKVLYTGGLQAVVDHLQLDLSTRTISVEVPEFTRYNNNWSYLKLASEQPESAFGNVEPIPRNAEPVLEALLGEGYTEAGEVFQYLSSRKENGNLREVRLWIPTASSRNTERCVVLGVGDLGWFDIGADGAISSQWPARGVVVPSQKG